jgi:hypothetical protein
MFDAQFSMARILKPFPNFETVYQGFDATVPIAFPGTLDRQAGEPGYDPYLLAGLPVPLGSRVMIWVPLAMYVQDDGSISLSTYQYQIIWRMRSIGDFVTSFDKNVPRDEIGPYHLRQKDVGVPDDPANPTATKRIVLPSSMQVLAYEQPEPSTTDTVYANGIIHLRGQYIIPNGQVPSGPLLPPPVDETTSNIFGLTGQGIFPFTQQAEGATPGGPVFFPFWFDAEGDEMMIFATRADITEETGSWDFTDPSLDRPFSATYGTNDGTRTPVPSVGIFVYTGSAP